ncbi:MAG: class I SAM-dependent RNA methyltransferase [Clostridiales bacterium]|nr:class I SAM-dependent RNA methyltransferase [Clostridiales bacterium]
MQTIEYVATCLFGLERFLGDEITALGYKRTETIDGRVSFIGDIAAIPRCNLWLRCAERLYIKMGSFHAKTFGELFEGTKSLPFEQWIGREDAFPVKGHSIKSTLFSIPDCQSIIKKAVAQRLDDCYGLSWFPETCVKYQIEFFILKDNVTLMIDTSGTPLHKRGYRQVGGAAPLRETLAAALVLNSRPRHNVLIWDPFCGSGTIPIEAAMIMTRRAPGLYRRFISEQFPQIPKELWAQTREEAHSLINNNTPFEAYATDINQQAVALATFNAKKAGVHSKVRCFTADALTIRTGGRRGTIVCNPPYGERLFERSQVEQLYAQMGRHFTSLAPWQVYILSSHEQFERHYGKRADKVRKVYNGMIPCYLYQYFKFKKP